MAKTPHIREFKYRNGTLTRSVLRSWNPNTWTLGPGTDVAINTSGGGLFNPKTTHLNITTPEGEVITIEAWAKDTAAATSMAAQIKADAIQR